MFASFRKNLQMLKRMAIPTKEQRRQLEEAMMMDPNNIQGRAILERRQLLKGNKPTGNVPTMMKLSKPRK